MNSGSVQNSVEKTFGAVISFPNYGSDVTSDNPFKENVTGGNERLTHK